MEEETEKFKAKVLNEICKHRDFSWFNFFLGILYIRIVDACIMDGCDVMYRQPGSRGKILHTWMQSVCEKLQSVLNLLFSFPN